MKTSEIELHSKKQSFKAFIYALCFALFSMVLLYSFTPNANASTKKTLENELQVGNENIVKIQELFIWKMSESLELDAQQEQKFANVIRDISTQKRNASTTIASLTKQIEGEKSQEKLKKLLSDYRLNLNLYSDAQKKEYDELLKVLSVEKLAKYFYLKNEISAKIKVRLMQRLYKTTDNNSKDFPTKSEQDNKNKNLDPAKEALDDI